MKKATVITSLSAPVSAIHICPDEFAFIFVHTHQIGDTKDKAESLKVIQEKDGTVLIVTNIKCKTVPCKKWCKDNKISFNG